MYVFKTNTGSYGFEYEYRRRRHRRAGFPTRRLAELAGEADRRQQQEAWIEDVWDVREPKLTAAPTLAAYVNGTYLPAKLPRLMPGSRVTVLSQLWRLVGEVPPEYAAGRRPLTHMPLGRLPLSALRHPVLDSYTAERLKVVAPGQVRQEIALLSRIVSHAVRAGIIGRHPMRGWMWPRAQARDYHVVARAEERALLAAATAAFAPWIILGLVTGLRKGELRLLEATALSWDHDTIRVRQSKTKRVKVIPMHPATRHLLRRLIRETPGSYVLGRRDGRAQLVSWVDWHWRRAVRLAGLRGRGVRFHDLRHTFATRLAQAGYDIATVGELMGHRPPYRTTLRYFHGSEDTKRRAILSLRPVKTPPSHRLVVHPTRINSGDSA